MNEEIAELNFFEYLAENISEVGMRLGEHIQLTLIAIAIAIAIGVPLGIFISYIRPMKKPVLGFASVVQALPSIALLGFLVPVLGIGELPAVFMVVIYSLLPIIKNTATGLSSISKETVEAARAIGMTRFQILARVKLPLALPVIMAGVRISAVTSVGLVTLSSFIGAGGLGYLIYSGIRTVNGMQILIGAVPACLLALAVDFLLAGVERLVTPGCFRPAKKVKREVKAIE